MRHRDAPVSATPDGKHQRASTTFELADIEFWLNMHLGLFGFGEYGNERTNDQTSQSFRNEKIIEALGVNGRATGDCLASQVCGARSWIQAPVIRKPLFTCASARFIVVESFRSVSASGKLTKLSAADFQLFE
ncbi:hypothetical protein R1flu_006907 [Riccia fluitans]|uniref:Uncharacterized protein n=1 Tax=Riccia fluitans TaxID=41844 RepID=A0ABD1YXK1_9MARC